MGIVVEGVEFRGTNARFPQVGMGDIEDDDRTRPGLLELGAPTWLLFDRVVHVNAGKSLRDRWRIIYQRPSGGSLLEVLATAVGQRETARQSQAPLWLGRVCECIHANYLEPVDIITLAEVAGVHPAHLSRVFREQTGQPVGAYVRRLRIDWAARELVHTDAALSDIALRAGFADQSHFTRAFKQETGLTPGSYRKSGRNGCS